MMLYLQEEGIFNSGDIICSTELSFKKQKQEHSIHFSTNVHLSGAIILLKIFS